MSAIDSLYAALPTWAQHAAVTIYGVRWRWLRFGAGFPASVEEFAGRDHLGAAEFARIQRDRLHALLSLCATHVPFYRAHWDQDVRAAAREGDISRIPMLEKEPLRRDPTAFVRDDRRATRTLVFHSSGSSGTPIASHWTVAELRRAMGLREARSARWAGVSFAVPRATFSGRMVEPDAESRGPFYRYNAAERQVYLSPFHLSARSAPEYVRALERHGVQWLTGYAMSFYILARFILEAKLRVPPLRAVITTSEKTTAEMRRAMEAAFGCRVYEEYSTVESALFASECEHGSLHVSPDACVLEILRADGTACAPGEAGEVVTTCLLRDHQPLVRFRLGDTAAWSTDACSCGRAMPVLREVIGRIEDVVVGPDGRELVRFHGVFTDQPHVRLGQIVQEAPDRIRVRVVPDDGFGAHDEQEIIARVHQRLGPLVRVEVERTDRIPLTAAGKFKAVISHVRRGPASRA